MQAHLRDPIVVDGKAVAPTGSPVTIRILDAVPAKAGDQYGYVDIYFEPLTLANGAMLPLRAPTGRLDIHVSAGHQATVQTEDTIEDIFLPEAVLYQVFRKGRNVVLGKGSIIRARTTATVSIDRGAIAVHTPTPLTLPNDAPAADFTAIPLARPMRPPTRAKQTPLPIPSQTPWSEPSPSPVASPSAPASPAASPT